MFRAFIDDSTTNFVDYGFEYAPSDREGWGTGYITWTMGGERTWRVRRSSPPFEHGCCPYSDTLCSLAQITDKAMGPNAAAGISERQVTGEPLYVLLNLGSVRAMPSLGFVYTFTDMR